MHDILGVVEAKVVDERPVTVERLGADPAVRLREVLRPHGRNKALQGCDEGAL